MKKLILLAVIWVVTWREYVLKKDLNYNTGEYKTCSVDVNEQRQEFDDKMKAQATMVMLEMDGAKNVTLWKQEKVEEKK